MTSLDIIILCILFVQFMCKCPKDFEDRADVWDIRDIRIEITRRRNER